MQEWDIEPHAAPPLAPVDRDCGGHGCGEEEEDDSSSLAWAIALIMLL
eukprot:gene38151-10935_t